MQIEAVVWRASNEGLVLADVLDWRSGVDEADQFDYRDGELPALGGGVLRDLLKPSLFGAKSRFITVWNAQKVKAEALGNLLDAITSASGKTTVHLGLIYDDGTRIPKALDALDPEVCDYGLLAKGGDALSWLTGYLDEFCGVRLSSDAKREIRLIAASDNSLVAELAASISAAAGEYEAKQTLDQEDVSGHLVKMGAANLFDLKDAISKGQVDKAVGYAMRSPSDVVFPLVTMLRKEWFLYELFWAGHSVSQAVAAFGRDTAKEEAEYEKKCRAATKKGEPLPDREDFHHPNISEKQVAFVKRNVPEFRPDARAKMWECLTEMDHSMKSGELSHALVISFAARAATINSIL